MPTAVGIESLFHSAIVYVNRQVIVTITIHWARVTWTNVNESLRTLHTDSYWTIMISLFAVSLSEFHDSHTINFEVISAIERKH